MEFRTTVKDFAEKIRNCLPPDVFIRVIVENDDNRELEGFVRKSVLPTISPEEQRRLLNLMPGEYHSDGSEELIKIIEESYRNTDIANLE